MNYKRTLQDLNLIDSFLFNEMLAHENADWFASMLIERITGTRPAKVHVVSERVVQGTDSDKHGIQIDAYIEVSETGDAKHKVHFQKKVLGTSGDSL